MHANPMHANPMRANPMRAGVERGEPQIGTWVTMIRNPAILSC
jgi:hypothetical protein